MQLTIISLAFALLMWSQSLKAQIRNWSIFNADAKKKFKPTQDSLVYNVPAPEAIEIDLLSSYYAQDGNNGAVQGGIGTEQLTDFTGKIIVKIPVKQKLNLNIEAGADYYSSASTEMIDNIRSGESSSDVRTHGNIGVSYKKNDQETFGVRVGGSTEYDYNSLSFGVDYRRISKDGNSTIGLSLQAFIDQWEIIYPTELRGKGALVPTNKRQSYNGSLTFSQVINKRMQMSVQLEGVYMNGLLSTPFHRVYFADQTVAKVEQLPGTRLKVPIGLRFNYHISDFLLARLHYRYYWDNWGVKAHTASIELPVKINRFLSVYPFYRYHKQSAATYFAPYKEHQTSEQYYTSDYDLSALSSQTYGFGFRYSPANGIARVKTPFKKRPVFMVKSIDLKYSHYERSTGLTGDIVSLGINFSF